MIKRKIVLDSSALLALIHNEKGSLVVENYIETSSIAMSTVNYSEVIGKLISSGIDISDFPAIIDDFGIALYPFDEIAARESARLRLETDSYGLSLGDRACLTLAKSLNAIALTADKQWSLIKLHSIKVKQIR